MPAALLVLALLALIVVPIVRERRDENATPGGEGEDLVLEPPLVLEPIFSAGADLLEAMRTQVRRIWAPPAAAAPYLDAISRAEVNFSLPDRLLARVLYQESGYQAKYITGQVKSSAGAIGIAQFMPGTAAELGVDPYDPWSSIDGAAKYLHQLYVRFGDWTRAIAAYNWGMGNVDRRGFENAPEETRNYVAKIMRDVGLS